MNLIESTIISIPEAKLLLEARIKEGNIIDIQNITLKQLSEFSRFDAEKAKLVIEILKTKFKLSHETAIQIVNICPETPEELRILIPPEKTFSKEEIAEILKLIDENRLKESSSNKLMS
jgi:DNA-directed RNA polymerase subunit F